MLLISHIDKDMDTIIARRGYNDTLGKNGGTTLHSQRNPTEVKNACKERVGGYASSLQDKNKNKI